MSVVEIGAVSSGFRNRPLSGPSSGMDGKRSEAHRRAIHEELKDMSKAAVQSLRKHEAEQDSCCRTKVTSGSQEEKKGQGWRPRRPLLCPVASRSRALATENKRGSL